MAAFNSQAFTPSGFDTATPAAAPAFNSAGFNSNAFYGTENAPGPRAFDGVGFDAQAFFATPNPATPGFSNRGFDGGAFYAGDDPLALAAFDGEGFAQAGFFATENPAIPEVPYSPFAADAAIANIALAAAPIASGIPGAAEVIPVYPPGYVFIDSGHRATGLEIPYLALVRRADPDFERNRRNETEYEFTRRTFRGNPPDRGAYGTGVNGTPEPNSYPGIWEAA